MAVATGDYTAEIVEHLRAAQFSRNALLVDALRRGADAAGYSQTLHIIESAIRILSEIQAAYPAVVKELLILPHFGFWAANCLIRLQDAASHGHALTPEAQREIGHIAAFAATAALRAGHYCELQLPVLDGMVYLPAMGQLRVGNVSESSWVQIRLDHVGARVVARLDHHRVLHNLIPSTTRNESPWTPTSHLRASSRGLSLNLLLDGSDPFLSQFGPASPPPSRQSLHAWRQSLRQAWRVLVRQNEPLARALAAGLTTLVPLRQSPGGRAISAASGWAWGAIALTLPSDPLAFAETLVHEFQHLVLAAVEDIAPLIHGDSEEIFYSPWRDDPRPISSLLQGTYAFLGVSAFWRQLRSARSPTVRRRAELAFALRKHNVTEVMAVLGESSVLTETGRSFLVGMEQRLTAWRSEPVSPSADAIACEIDAEHRLRWRLANLRPDEGVIDSLAGAWLANPSAVLGQIDVPTALLPSPSPGLTDRSALLERHFVGSGTACCFRHGGNVSISGDLAFSRGDMISARLAYLQRLSRARDPDAWVGLMLVLRRLGVLSSGWSARQSIEVVVALADRVRTMAGQSPDAEALLLWARSIWGESAAKHG